MKTWNEIIHFDSSVDPKLKYLQAIEKGDYCLCYRVHDESFINENLSYHKCNKELNAICDIANGEDKSKSIYYFYPHTAVPRFEGEHAVGLKNQTLSTLCQKRIEPIEYNFSDIDEGAVWIIDENFGTIGEIHQILYMSRQRLAWKIIFFIKAQNLTMWDLLNNKKFKVFF